MTLNTSVAGRLGPLTVDALPAGMYLSTSVHDSDTPVSVPEMANILVGYAATKGLVPAGPLCRIRTAASGSVEYRCHVVPAEAGSRSDEPPLATSREMRLLELPRQLIARAVVIPDGDDPIGEVNPDVWTAFDTLVSAEGRPKHTDLSPDKEAGRLDWFYTVFPKTPQYCNARTEREIGVWLTEMPPPVPVILDHDGGVDDFVALVIVAAAQAAYAKQHQKEKPEGDGEGATQNSSEDLLPNAVRPVKLIGVTVVDADCYAEPTVEICKRVLSLFASGTAADELLAVPVAAGPFTGCAAPFPSEWRQDCLKLIDQPVLHTPAVNAALVRRNKTAVVEDEYKGNGHKLLAKLVLESPSPVTIIVTGPLSNVAWAIETFGTAFTENVRSLVVMGGALDVPGNVINANLPEKANKVNGSAEWNIYWDAPAAKKVLECPLLRHKLLFTLDSTNAVPVSDNFVRRFGSVTGGSNGSPTPLAQFVGGAWAQCTFLSKCFGEDRGYYAWDALTAAYVVAPGLAQLVPTRLRVVDKSGSKKEGRTIRTDTRPIHAYHIPGAPSAVPEPEINEKEPGSTVCVASNIDATLFYRLMLAMCRVS